ncbi:MAG: DNA-binding protein [Bacteroidetes bacterium GWF2_43_63]|nr:MAG: DNA-binding protein [Bacteroidetes bacterium GWE2_42_42]OFY56346.1 MAG: DNA-binding protein [Bacteroidetes bacterium GWF2_43_63]HBG69692.1 DNA-binding protein [Bacteroidales bacterium]HCB61959.1 DNA-binding protein [Bacteroidales bacterium]HCY42262.1 DNA-binding protein [Prolixibacteraceae bacterium]
MDVITIESAAYAKIVRRIDDIEQKILDIVKKAQNPLSERWLDNQQLCQVLNISKRLLQSYRDEKQIPFSQINHKIYYKASDVEKFLTKNYKPLIGY